MRRRDFLAAASAGAPGLLLGGAAASGRAEVDGRAVGVAVVGLGSYARFVIERIRGAMGVQVAALVSGDHAKASQLANAEGLPANAICDYEQFDSIANDERIDAVHICLPVGLQAEYAERALRAGKHVLCEKPLASTTAAAKSLTKLAEDRGLILMPAYRAWFSAHVQHVRRALAKRTYGDLVAIDAHKGFRMQASPASWRFDPALAGGGCLFDIGVYSVQLCRWFAGGLPQRVSAMRSHTKGAPWAEALEDHIAFTLEFSGGVIATTSASWRHRLQNRACAATTNAWLNLDPATPAIGERLTIGLERPNRIEEVLLPPDDQLPKMYRHFAECIRGRATPELAPQDGIDDLRVMEAIYSAAHERHTVDV